MVDQSEILKAALCALDEGLVVLDCEAKVLFWSPAATAISGYLGSEMLGRPLPDGFYEVDATHLGPVQHDTAVAVATTRDRPVLANIRHLQGHTLPAMMHRIALRDEMGGRLGTLLRFYTVEEIDTVLHGDTEGDSFSDQRLEQSLSAIEDRLDEAQREWTNNAVPYGVMWILVDQAPALRKTHGHDASEAMMAIVEKTLLHGLRPTEILGRWGSNEFLVLAHERTMEMLDAHGRYLAGLTRTADFRWWGDRTSLTVSIGVAQAEISESLSCLLKRAQKAMHHSQYAGGNKVTSLSARDMANAGGQECSQS
jgi:diguanylate cyclase (GGDEF)-like protein/PAS domain S-box-containing protein